MTVDQDRWKHFEVPDQRGRTALVTGANTGVGFEVAVALAAAGATVIMAARDAERGAAAMERVRAAVPEARLEPLQLDLTSLDSVRTAASAVQARGGAIDVLVNNAGVMWAPHSLTRDGFELHLGTNHLGHFAFAGLVLDRLLGTPESRVVVVSSPAHTKMATTIELDDWAWEQRRYRPAAAYGQSKLANMLYALELEQRLRAAGVPTIAVATHPGSARTELNRHLPLPFRGPSWGLARFITHPAPVGARSLLVAATAPDVTGGDYVGPGGRNEFTGHPVLLSPSAESRDPDARARLWARSEEVTGVSYPL